MRKKIFYQVILFSFIISSLTSCAFISKRKLLRSTVLKQQFPQSNYDGFHSHPSKNLSQSCLEGQFSLTEPKTGKQRCSLIPKAAALRNLGGGHKAYQCKIKMNPQFIKKGYIRSPEGRVVDPHSYRCSNGAAFLERRKLHTRIKCLSEDPYYDPLTGNFTSRLETALRSCKPLK